MPVRVAAERTSLALRGNDSIRTVYEADHVLFFEKNVRPKVEKAMLVLSGIIAG